MIPITVALPENKLTFFKELVTSLNFKAIDVSADVDFDIPEPCKKMVLERKKNSKPENWLRWDEVKDNFKLD